MGSGVRTRGRRASARSGEVAVADVPADEEPKAAALDSERTAAALVGTRKRGRKGQQVQEQVRSGGGRGPLVGSKGGGDEQQTAWRLHERSWHRSG